jgi:hypothetical protein
LQYLEGPSKLSYSLEVNLPVGLHFFNDMTMREDEKLKDKAKHIIRVGAGMKRYVYDSANLQTYCIEPWKSYADKNNPPTANWSEDYLNDAKNVEWAKERWDNMKKQSPAKAVDIITAWVKDAKALIPHQSDDLLYVVGPNALKTVEKGYHIKLNENAKDINDFLREHM